MSDQSVPNTPGDDVVSGDESKVNSADGAPQEEKMGDEAEVVVEEVAVVVDGPEAVTSVDPADGPVAPPPPVPPVLEKTGEPIPENDRLMAALAYLLWFVGPAIILLSPNLAAQRFQRYHAIQGLGLAVVLAADTLVTVVLGMVLCCVWVLLLIPLCATVYCAVLAYEGKYFEIPILTNVMVSEGWLEQE